MEKADAKMPEGQAPSATSEGTARESDKMPLPAVETDELSLNDSGPETALCW